jgi:hypothetical protein
MHGPGSRLAGFTLTCLIALLLCLPDADARERRGRAQTGAAKSGQIHRTVTRTGPDGTARTSTHDSRWQRADGKWTRDTVHTGPGGKQGTTHVEGAKTGNGYTRQSTHTGPNGGVTTRNTTGSYDPETKTWTKDVTRTGRDGATGTTHVERQRTEGGYTKTTTHTGPQGGVTTRNAAGSYDPASQTWTHDATTTRPDGSTATSHGVRTRTEDGYQSTVTHTGPKGTTTVEGQASWDPETKTFTREKLMTRPDGTTSKTEVTTQVTPDAPEAAPAE